MHQVPHVDISTLYFTGMFINSLLLKVFLRTLPILNGCGVSPFIL